MRAALHPSDEAHAARWVEVLTQKPTLATFTSRITMKGFALKRGPTGRNLFNWSRRFFLLQEPFLSYFASNDPKTPCRGTIYLVGAGIEHVEHYPGRPHVIKIEPLVRRNLRQVREVDDENNFYISFESDKDVERWLEVLQTAARCSANADSGDGEHRQNASCGLTDVPQTGETAASLREDASAAVLLLDDEDVGYENFFAAEPSAADDMAKLVAFGTQDGRRHPTAASSALAVASDAKRKCFYNPQDVVRCRNSDHVHLMHCSACHISPIHGFMYTCVVCDDCHLCAACFREEDHCPRHCFKVEPDIDGESARLPPSLEGCCKAFRTVELVAFEAIFRSIGGVLASASTKPLPKRRLISFWNQSIAQGVAVEPIDEKLLLRVCRLPATVDFDEFMVLVRCKLMRCVATYASVLDAFDCLARMVEVVHGASTTADDEQAHPRQHTQQQCASPSTVKGLRHLELAALNVFIGACTADGATLGVNVLLSLLLRVHAAASGNDDVTESHVAEVVSLRGTSEPIDDVIMHVEILASHFADRLASIPPEVHGIIEGIEMSLLFDRNEGLGMYSPQSESFHPCFCDNCGVHPIIGYRYKCTIRDDFDLCQRCFSNASVSGGSQYTKYPGGSILDPPRLTARPKRRDDITSSPRGGNQKRVQFDDI